MTSITEMIGSAFGGLGNAATSFVGSTLGALSGKLEGMGKQVLGTVTGVVTRAFSSVGALVDSFWSRVHTWLSEHMLVGLLAIAAAVVTAGLWFPLVRAVLKNVFAAVAAFFRGLWRTLGTAVKGLFGVPLALIRGH